MRNYESPSEDRDYYYLVINKNKLDDVFVVSLKGLKDAHPAHNNMPFQSNWDKCRIPVERNWEQAKLFLLGTWAEAIKKGIEKYSEGMIKHYPEFFKEFNDKKREY